MELIVNIGNTNLRFGLFYYNQCIVTWIIKNKPIKSKNEYFIEFKNMFENYLVDKNKIKKVIVGSVVPSVTIDICKVLRRVLNLNIILVDKNTFSKVSHKSNQIGTDLYANAVAAHYNYKISNKIVVDFGTSLSFIAIDYNGKIKGVIIAPGIQTSLNALIENTSQLKNIQLKKPKKVLGINTEHCIQSGIIYGFLSMLEGLIKRINNELKILTKNKKSIVIATGGGVKEFCIYSKSINFIDQLHTLKGLKILGTSL